MAEPLNNSRDEADLVRATLAGDDDAFAALLDAHLRHVRTFLALKSPSAQLVDELAHDTFVFAFRHLGDFEPGTSFRAWVRAIAWNLLRAEVQRFARMQAQREKMTEWQLADWESSAAEAVPSDESEYLFDCLARLDETHRELIALKYRDEHSTEDIAARLKRSLAWVRVSLFRVRQQLRTCIEARQAEKQPC